MPESPPTADRRAALRARHRRAIVDAAAALMGESTGADFTVDELAARADVSRRTVFNHFASLDDIVTEVCSDVLGAVVDSLEQNGHTAQQGVSPQDGGASMLDEVASALRSTDLVTPMAYLTRVLSSTDPKGSARQGVIFLRAFTDVSERLSASLLRQHPSVDELTVRLLVGPLMGGLVVLHPTWAATTGAADDEGSRRVWSELVERLLETVRNGYREEAHHPTT